MQSSSPAWRQAAVGPSALAAVLLTMISPAHTHARVAATDLDQVVVTASRTARTQDQTLAAITVIDRDDIERLQPDSLPDLLRGTPGVSLSNNGGPGKATSLFLRGTESDHVLVLVDGIRIGSATSGAAALQDIPIEQIERIEIVRGPFSSLYGSEALGGVIQIFTRQPQSAFAPTFSFGVGSFDTQRASAGVGGRGGRGWYSINAAHEDTDGIDAFRGNPALARPERFRDPDLDGYRNRSLALQGGYRFNDAWQADARLLRAEGRNEYDGSLNNEADSVQQVLGARVRFALTDRLALTANAGRSADRSDAFLRGVYSSTFDTRRGQASLQADIGAGGRLVSVGVDWNRDEVDSSTAYRVDRRSNRGLFWQWQQDLGAHALQAGVRHDDNSQFGGRTTGSALWGWSVSDALRLTASAGTAFKAPTFNELYFPGYGNPGLQPETSRSVELGVRGRHGGGGWTLNGFDTRIDDLIAYDATLGEFGGPANIDRARIRGVEAGADAVLAGWSVQGSASWLDPRNDAGGRHQGNVLPRRARATARVDADRRFGAIGLGASVIASGERYDDLANTRRLGGYATTDLRLAYAVNAAWSVQFAARNVFDRRYETAAFYRQPGRNYQLTVRYRPAR